MKLKFSILLIYAILFLLVCIGFTIYNYHELSSNEGWGIVGMFGLFGIGGLLLVAALVLQLVIKNKFWLNAVGATIAIIMTILLFRGGF